MRLTDGHVDGLKDGDRERRGFSGTGLRLCNDIASLDDRKNGTLLDSRGLFKVCAILVKRNKLYACEINVLYA